MPHVTPLQALTFPYVLTLVARCEFDPRRQDLFLSCFGSILTRMFLEMVALHERYIRVNLRNKFETQMRMLMLCEFCKIINALAERQLLGLQLVVRVSWRERHIIV